MSIYNVGNGFQLITLTVDITTIGLAASRAIIVTDGHPFANAGHSTNATGDIVTREIGAATWLKNKSLRIMTKVDLLGDDLENEIESKRISANYILGNGEDGLITFGDPLKKFSRDFSIVILYKEIFLR